MVGDRLHRVSLPMIALIVSFAAVLFGTSRDQPDRIYRAPEELSYPSPETIPSGGTAPVNVTPTSSTKQGWRVVFDDEFENAQLDQKKWHTEFWWGRVNAPDTQFYAPDAFDFGRGMLRIKGEKRPMQGYAYTSGLISAHDLFTFTYGYVEARVKVPHGQGLWPTFWLLSANNPQGSIDEIDVMEILGNEPRRLHMALHFTDTQGQPQVVSSNYLGPDFSEDFHTFAADWSPAAVVWYVDGNERFRLTENVPQGPMYVIATMSAGGRWSGYPDETTVFPAYFDIDYIRIYQR